MMSKPHLAKSLTSFCASLMMILTWGFIQPGCLGHQLLSLLQERGMDDFVAHCLGLRSFLIRSRARLGASQAVRPS